MKNYKNKSGVISKSVKSSKAVLAATLATIGLGVANSAMGAIADVQSIVTTQINGSTTTQTGVSGAGQGSGFTSGHTYNETYLGGDLEITKINTATMSFVPTGLANTVVDRSNSTTNNTDTIWYAGSGTYSSTNLTFMSKPASTVSQAFSGNNLLVGADNLFNDAGNSQNNNTNIERLDFIFPSGITASALQAFAVFERGLTNQHDAFKIAAITGLDGLGNPDHYGNLVSLTSGNWGTPNVEPTSEYLVTRKNDQLANDSQHPSDMVDQPIGGVVVPTDSLAGDGTTIYGYSLFAGDVTGTGDQLVDWKNSTFFPSGTTEFTGGGLDPVGTAAVLYTSAVPEPTSGMLALLGVSGFMTRRSKRKQA